MVKKQNIDKSPPKGAVKFSITLSEEQKYSKSEILRHPFNFIVGKAGVDRDWETYRYFVF